MSELSRMLGHPDGVRELLDSWETPHHTHILIGGENILLIYLNNLQMNYFPANVNLNIKNAYVGEALAKTFLYVNEV